MGADPYLVVVDRQAHLFTTQSATADVPVLTDGTVTDALPTMPPWALAGFTWAPAVHRFGDRFELAFTALNRGSEKQCVGVAVADDVAGPYVANDEPLVCELDGGGSIDPSFIELNDGSTTLLWKTDGNCCGLPTAIRSAPLTADGRSLAGPAMTLLVADQPWEDGIVEAPSMARLDDGRWLLLYSGNRWDTDDYDIGAAWGAAPAGRSSRPRWCSTSGAPGPGPCASVTSPPTATT